MLERVVLVGALLLVLVGCAGGLLALARGLGVRIPRRAAVYGVVLATTVLTPWLLRPQLLAATDFLSKGAIPGAPALEDPGRYEGLNDQALQFFPWEIELRRLWSSGQLGFWSDSLEGGSSPWVNPQASVLSPTAWAARMFPVRHFFLIKIAVQLLVCFLGTVLLVRRLGGSISGGCLAGLAAALGGGMIPWATFTHSTAAAWVPWTTAGLVTVVRCPKPRSLAVSGLLICFLLLSGHPEVAFAGGALGLVVAFSVRRPRGVLRKQIGAAFLVASMGFLLAAPAVLPFLGVLGQSQRVAEVSVLQRVLQDADLSLAPSSWFLSEGAGLAEVVLHPFAFGRPFVSEYSGVFNWLETGAGYAGIFALAGAVLAAGLGLRRAMALLGFWAIAVLLASGFIPLLWLVRWLPGFSAMAFPRALLVASIALAVAAGLGFDAVRRVAPNLLAWAGLVLVAVASAWAGGGEHLVLTVVVWGLIFVALFFGEPHFTQQNSTQQNSTQQCFTQPDHKKLEERRLAGGQATAVKGEPGVRTPAAYSTAQVRWRLCLVGAILLAQLPWAWLMLPKGSPAGFYPPSSVFQSLAAAVEDARLDIPGRVIGGGFLGYPSLLSVYGFHQTRSHNPMAPVGWLRVNRAAFGFSPDAKHYFSEVENLNGTWLDVLGVAAVLSTEAASRTLIDEEAGDLELVAENSPFLIYRNPNALQRWFPARTWEVVDEDSLHHRMLNLTNARHVLVSHSPTGSFLSGAQRVPVGEQQIGPRLLASGVAPGSVDLRIEWAEGSTGDGFLMATTLAVPEGWKVSARNEDGADVPVQLTTVHGAFLGAWIPEGVTAVKLRFYPPLINWGLAGFLLGVVLMALVVRSRALASWGCFRGRVSSV